MDSLGNQDQCLSAFNFTDSSCIWAQDIVITHISKRELGHSYNILQDVKMWVWTLL